MLTHVCLLDVPQDDSELEAGSQSPLVMSRACAAVWANRAWRSDGGETVLGRFVAEYGYLVHLLSTACLL